MVSYTCNVGTMLSDMVWGYDSMIHGRRIMLGTTYSMLFRDG